MGRWEPDARGRLERAALELYTEQGFEQTTIAQITARAGLTRRTFFNHFADKPEVLFWGHAALEETYRSAIAAAPRSAAPLDVVREALRAAAALHEPRRELVSKRQLVIDANSPLQEREHLKRATVAGIIADGLRHRGVTEPTASLLGETGAAVFKVAYDQWVLDDRNRGRLSQLVDEAVELLRATTSRR